ncbi:hypothetical protein OPQ81_005528 [Rhizoctonia solani]|nr:hypothetical protein OPQ81_005528 [Rhizoctonia solani]
MASEESFTRVSHPPNIGHAPTQNSRPSNPPAPNTQETTYIRVGRGIVPITRYEKNVRGGKNIAGDLAVTSVCGTAFLQRTAPLSSKFLVRADLQYNYSEKQPPCDFSGVEVPVLNIAPARVEQNEVEPSKLRKPHSRGQLHPVTVSQSISSRNLGSSSPPPPSSAQNMYNQSPSTHNETEEDRLRDGQLLLDLLGVNNNPSTSPPTTEHIRPYRLPIPIPEPEPDPEPGLGPELETDQASTPRVRRLPPVPVQFPVPVLNIVPPHDSQDAFAYVFGPNHRSTHMEQRVSTAPPPYVARQSAMLDRHMRPIREQPILPDHKREMPLPPVAPLTIRRKAKARNQGEAEC